MILGNIQWNEEILVIIAQHDDCVAQECTGLA